MWCITFMWNVGIQWRPIQMRAFDSNESWQSDSTLSLMPLFLVEGQKKSRHFLIRMKRSPLNSTLQYLPMVDSLYIKQAEANVCSGTITYTFATSSCKAKRNHPNICWNFVATAQLRIGSAFQTLGIGLIKCHSYMLYCIGLLNKRVWAFKPVPERALSSEGL